MTRRRPLLAGVAAAVAVSGLVAVWATLDGRSPPLPGDARADRVVVRKSVHELTLYRGDQPLKSYAVALGRGEPGAKRRQGDNRAPEGCYRISGRNLNSAYHRALRISYPAAADLAAAAARGEDPGGDVMIHGIRNGLGWLGRLHRLIDWTAGCIAVTDREIEEIWRAVPDGTPIDIRP